MNETHAQIVDRVALLHLGFDQAFARPPAPPAEDREDLLALRVGDERYALRVRESTGLLRCGRIVPLPGPLPELLGITGIRGGLVPVYSLAALLGRGAAAEAPHWLVLCERDDPVALAVGDLEGLWQAPRAELCPAGGAGSGHIVEIAPGPPPRAILSIPSVMRAVRQRAGGPAKEP
jgi:chemotaxis signal transduction protein